MEDIFKSLTIPGWTVVILNLIGLIMGIAAIVFVIGVVKKQSKNSKKCRFCAETIQREAVVCRFCQRDLP